MCGIVGILGKGDVAPIVMSRLKALEYRGYDSAGVATVCADGIDLRRAAGKLCNLSALLDNDPLRGASAIGHTRWATHGAATEGNAHPHSTGRVAVVHNGIIENHYELRDELEREGIVFTSETDTETVVRYVDWAMSTGGRNAVEAVRDCLARIRGAFALAFLFAGDDDLMIVARQGSPLVIGRGDGEMYAGSDAYALAGLTNRVTYLEDGDMAVLTRTAFTVFDHAGKPQPREERISAAAETVVDKGGHKHFMAKEIHEQPYVIGHTLTRYLDPLAMRSAIEAVEFPFAELSRLTISACGTAFYAGAIASYWFESWARLPVQIDIASELRYRDAPYAAGGGAIFISQSGETADTLAALVNARAHDQRTAAIVNVPESTIARTADVLFPTAAGPEISVASTKAFTCQLAVLACLALSAGRQRGVLSADAERAIVSDLLAIPRLAASALRLAERIEEATRRIAKARDVLFIGRGVSYPLAMEGALKLKEISYIHAEGYAAGELKHGPIALIDEHTPVIALAPSDRHFEKTLSNVQEIVARGAKVVLIVDERGVGAASKIAADIIETPYTNELLSPFVNVIPMQLLAYHTAIAKGTDVDQPRNLAKSVTVE
ncbi:MAG: glutamine--fructose-6-phosphate transaminase (isomerizing) [Alphaproteobacteria bacterium]|nr:glutamine--fructose-6-phosphate transaminase (isomerizing) [Alphaproteobacteria bacterium]